MRTTTTIYWPALWPSSALVMTLAMSGVALLTGGCGGKFGDASVGGDDGGGSDASALDGGASDASSHDGGGADGGATDGGWSPVCPDSAPAIGSACTREGTECEYGSDRELACNLLVSCAQGAWRKSTTPGTCPPPGPNPSECAPTFEGNVRGAACMPNGIECRYPRGDCRCSTFSGGPPPPPDAGATWHCDDPGPGCPVPRPRVGSACAMPGLSCMYKECELGESCDHGVWNVENVACASPPTPVPPAPGH